LFVFTGSALVAAPVVAGDYARVAGTIAEFRRGNAAQTLTQLATNPQIERCGSTTPIKPTMLTLPLQRDGELVLSSEPPVPRQQPPRTGRGAGARPERPLAHRSRRCVQWQQPGPDGTRRAGDVAKGLQGVLAHDFGVWRLQPTLAPAFEPRNPRTATPAPVGGTLKVASLNVLNYFTTLGDRGADNALELARQRDKLVATIVALERG